MGTSRPCASWISTATMETSSPSAPICARSGRRTIFAAGPGGFAFRRQRHLAALVAAGFERPRSVFHLPRQVRILDHVLRAQALAVQEKLHPLQVAVDPDVDLLAFLSGPVPVRKHVQRRASSPTRPVVVEVVLGEAAHVQDAEVRVDAGPAVGRGLAAVVEAGPGEAAGQEGPLVVEFPPDFGESGPGRAVDVVGADVAPSRLSGLLLSLEASPPAYQPRVQTVLAVSVPNIGSLGKFLWKPVHLPLVVVEALHVHHRGDAGGAISAVHGPR